ncbi:MAG: hypothetical protein U0930_12500 [Pirellulales bacterium]
MLWLKTKASIAVYLIDLFHAAGGGWEHGCELIANAWNCRSFKIHSSLNPLSETPSHLVSFIHLNAVTSVDSAKYAASEFRCKRPNALQFAAASIFTNCVITATFS